MFRGKETCAAIREVYSFLFPKKKDLKRALERVNLETAVQSLRYRAEEILAYQTHGTDDAAFTYRGPVLFQQRGYKVCSRTIRHHSTEVETDYLRELWLLEDARFVELSVVTVQYRSATEGYYTRYRTVHHFMEEKDWKDYSPEEVIDLFEDFSRHPFDASGIDYYEV